MSSFGPRIAWFSCLPRGEESASPSEYVSKVLLPLLRERAEVELFDDSFADYPGFPTKHYLTAWARHRERPFDAFFYQLEDSRRTAFSRTHLALEPGLVWFHDFLLTDDGPEPILNSAWSRVAQKFQKPALDWPARGAEFTRPRPHAVRELGVGGVPIFSSEKDLKEYYNYVGSSEQLRRIFETSQAELLSRGIGADAEISARVAGQDRPAGFFIPYPAPEEAFRLSRPAPQGDCYRIGMAAPPRVEFRVHSVLEALKKLLGSGRNFLFTWLVADSAEERKARELLADFDLDHARSGMRCEIVIGRSPERWLERLPQFDAVVHLHFSVFGQPGPLLALSLASGTPALVSDFGASDFLPSSVVLKVEPGAREVAEISEALAALSRGALRMSTAEIRTAARERFDASLIAEEVLRVLRLTQPSLRQMRLRWSELQREARAALLQEISEREGQAGAACWYEREQDFVLRDSFRELGWERPA